MYYVEGQENDGQAHATAQVNQGAGWSSIRFFFINN
jgi:hypothetical protein